jgi:spoIIIJ-associated protein
MREVIMTGKTVDEATEKALSALGISADEATIEVLELPQKKLFKSIPAKVRVAADEPETAPAAEPKKAAEPAPKKPQPAAAPKAAAPKKPAEVPAQAPAKEPVKEVVSQPAEQKEPEAAPVADTLAEVPFDMHENPAVEAAAVYLKEVCEKMGVPGIEVAAVKQGETVILTVEGDNTGVLIGHRGDVMESLSYLCSLVANRQGGDYIKLGLDINHYRAKREANLATLAKRIGAKVARTGRSHTLEPMNPYERRIIHSAISEMEGVKSESVGEGIGRRVVISSTDPNARKGGGKYGNNNRTDRSRGPRRDGNSANRDNRGGRAPRGPRRDGGYQKSSVPARDFADRPRNPNAAPTVPKRTESINDGADLPLFGKIEL